MTKDKLALYGGPPVRKSYLPYGKQWLDPDDIQAVMETLKSDWLTTGPRIDRFERAIARYVNTTYAVAFSSGTAALHAACFAAGIKPGDEVITSPLTFAASANCVLYVGGSPVFADVDLKTYNISPSSIRALINEKTRAIITVDFTGQPAEYEEILKIAKENNLIVIGDAAHALGAEYKGAMVGSLCDMTMFSFHPVKHITTGEGGVITTNNALYYEKLKLFRSHGITRDSDQLIDHPGDWYYEMQSLGYNYRITDIQASLGFSQLNKLDTFLKKRRDYADAYNQAFEKLEGTILPYQSKSTLSSWHLYILRLDLQKLSVDRALIYKALQRENIGVNVHYLPVYLHPYYQKLGYQKGICPQAEAIYHSIITLPLFPKMSQQDVEDVIHGVKKVISIMKK
ncbi:UDP-4-amino-4,6-dideoxy-N-acetyl-beta-L-altrosamine transaminase [Halobacillus sp. Marseille-Q1614]|uniref:UDP-4-amino-4, 6-dideoxy-N-acetyl-beta-L-altrosamine transaminase n=1 Tax=Halobacillus sp. Marseille-Q1614 TaxID=2709134 RepID=UPI001570F7D4|nr:UDP-4-amino-4,6-dideoxy-N-acetyl-beta-L-altrosamine transaminase [Halobacillus sp. Marseille-Q1614]